MGRGDESTEPSAVDIGSRLELLLDDHLIDSVDKLSFVLNAPIMKEEVIEFDAPWESSCDYVTVFKDADRYRMYYASRLKIPGSC